MIKGILLGIFSSIFIVSLIFAVSGLTNSLQPNLITGNIIGSSQATNYSLLAAFLSLIACFIVAMWIRSDFIY